MFTPIQVYYLNRLNIIREDPAKYADSLGIDLNEGLDPGTLSADPKPPMRLESLLTSMSDAHSQEMLDLDYYSHDSPNTGGTGDRFDDSLYNYIAYGENLGIVPTDSVLSEYYTADLMLDALFIDEGVVGRGHRITMLNPAYRDFGVGHKVGEWSGSVNTHILTMLFGLSYDSTLNALGFVFEDLDSDGYFDIGEGLSGIEIEVFNSEDISVGTYFSESTGYYDIPLGAGTFTLKAYTPDYTVEQTVTLTTENQYMPLFWDSLGRDKPAVTFQANKTDFLANLPYTSILNPVNVASAKDSTPLTITWGVTDVNRVTINKQEVSFSGTLILENFTVLSFTLEAYGPAGYVKSTLSLTPRLYQRFNSVFS